MTLNNYAYYRLSDGYIENAILIDIDVAKTLVWPDGYAIVSMHDDLTDKHLGCSIGWSYINGQFVEPEKPIPPEKPPAPPAAAVPS